MMMKRGYTLVEVIIYVALVALLVIATVGLIFTFSRSFSDFRLGRAINDSARVTLERLAHEVREAGSVDLAQSQLNSHPGTLVLKLDGVETVRFITQNGAILLAEDGSGIFASTTAPRVTVESAIFRFISTPVSQALRAELTLSARQGSLVKTANFYTTAVLRESY